MQRIKLDAIDRRILAELQADGRITNVELSKRAGISAPPCLRRVRALEEQGLIRGYHADIDPKPLGYEVEFFAMVGLGSQAEPDLKAFIEQVQAWPHIREAHMLSGEVDFILKGLARDLAGFHAIVGELTATRNVAHVKTSFVIRATKREPGVPMDGLDPKRRNG